MELAGTQLTVTMAQRGSTLITNIEPSAQLVYTLYDEGPPLADCDLIAASMPLALARKTHILLTEQAKHQAMRGGNVPEAASVNAGELDQRVAEAQGREAALRREIAQRRSNAVDLYNRWQQADARARTLARPSTMTVPPPTGEPSSN